MTEAGKDAGENARPPILQLNNLESSYGPVKAIRGVSLSVKEGSIVTVLGSNGAGKSTILKTISGIIDPQKGSVLFRGQAIQKLDPARIVRMGIVQVPEGREIFPFLTVSENLLMGAYVRPASDKAEVAKDVEAVFNYFPILRERSQQPAGQLSGGQQQMLAISRALLARPSIILLDEPSLGLSPRLTREIFEIIVRINRERGVTLLVVEQNAMVALKYSDYGYVLEVGRIVMEDNCKALLEKDDIREFYLGIKDSGVRGTRRWKKKKNWR
jgi:branched-chain amino acid transport system ATP-binding protein